MTLLRFLLTLVVTVPFVFIHAQDDESSRASIVQVLFGIVKGQSYYAQFTLGENDDTPESSSFKLLFDTGSSNDAVAGVGSDHVKVFSCTASPTCVATSTDVSIEYGDGSAFIKGKIVSESISSPGMEIHAAVPFIEIYDERRFFQSAAFDGILGAAYQVLAQPQGNAPPSLQDTIIAADGLYDSFGTLLCGIWHPLLQGLKINEDDPIDAGQWLIGGRDLPNGDQVFTGEMWYTPIAQEKWYVVPITDMAVAGESLGLDCIEYNAPQSILDSGSSNLIIVQPAYRVLMRKLLEAADNLGLSRDVLSPDWICCTAECDPSNPSALVLSMPPLDISLAQDTVDGSGSFSVSVGPEYYFRPVLDQTGARCRAFGITEGSSTILGTVFMDGLYTYHDRASQRIGLAVAKDTACVNGAKSSKILRPAASGKDSGRWCACLSEKIREDSHLAGYIPNQSACFFWRWWMTVLVVCGVIMLTSIGVMCLVQRKRKKNRQHKMSGYDCRPSIVVVSPPQERVSVPSPQAQQQQSSYASLRSTVLEDIPLAESPQGKARQDKTMPKLETKSRRRRKTAKAKIERKTKPYATRAKRKQKAKTQAKIKTQSVTREPSMEHWTRASTQRTVSVDEDLDHEPSRRTSLSIRNSSYAFLSRLIGSTT